MQTFVATVKVDLGSISFGTHGAKSCRDGYISSLQYNLYDLVYDKLIKHYAPLQARDMIYQDGVPISLLLLYNDTLKVHIDLQVQSYRSFTISSKFIDDLHARYATVKIGVQSRSDYFDQSVKKWYTFDGGLDAIAASWWMILIDRDAIHATFENNDSLFDLMVRGEEYFSERFYELWQDKSLEPPIWQWILSGCGPLATSSYCMDDDVYGTPTILRAIRRSIEHPVIDLKSMFSTDSQTV